MDIIVLLILTIITAEGQPDRVRRMPEPSIEKCLEDAAAFMATGIPEREKKAGAEGLAVQCRANAAALKPDERS